MKGGMLKLQLILVLIAIAMVIIYMFIGAVGAMTMSDGCFYRYPMGDKVSNIDDDDKDYSMDSGVGVTDAVAQTVIVNANGQYVKNINGVQTNKQYGEWVSSNFLVSKDAKDGKLDYNITGEVSLCKATIPKYNLMQDNNLTTYDNKEVEIPKIDEHQNNNDESKQPLWLIFDANQFVGEFRNIIEIHDGDKYEIYLKKDRKDARIPHSERNIFSGAIIQDPNNCDEGFDNYSPICGRFSIYGKNTYDSFGIDVSCVKEESDKKKLSEMYLTPGYYKFDGTNTIEPGDANEGRTPRNPTLDVCKNKEVNSISLDEFKKEMTKNNFQFWNSADNVTGLYFRIATTVNDTQNIVLDSDKSNTPNARDMVNFNTAANLSSTYQELLEKAHKAKFKNLNYIKILDNNILSKSFKLYSTPENSDTEDTANIAYLQYRFNDYSGSDADNSGGYVIGVRQSPCITKNGNQFKGKLRGNVHGSSKHNGQVEYVIMPQGVNPNNAGNMPDNSRINPLNPDANGTGSKEMSSELDDIGIDSGIIWFRVGNDINLYEKSSGQYSIAITAKTPTNSFFDKIISPIITFVKKGLVGVDGKGASYQIFAKMTCYKQADKSSCFQFFNYIRALLIIYIISYAAMFLIGMVQINQTDLIIRSIKIALIAAVMHEKTFELFLEFVFPMATGFVDGIIANLSGYGVDPKDAVSGGAFKFMNEILTKIFFSKTFSAQMMALLGMGLNGVIYFILIFVVLIVSVIVAFRAIAVYIMAYLALAVLLGIAPLFLTFILFETTRSLFENWVKFTFRYMIEPMILLAGIMILSQLFAIYLDYVIGYSVCWKCAIPIKIPFPSIPGFNPAFLDVPMFCINWFMPWGVDYRSGQVGLNMQNIVALIILGYCMWGYVDFAKSLTMAICGGMSGSSATDMGGRMTSAIENNAMSSIGMDKNTRGQIQNRAKAFMSERKGDTKSKNNKPNQEQKSENTTRRK